MAIKLLDNFMSPITGRILCDSGMILAGDENGIAMPSNDFPIDVLPDIAFVLNDGNEETRSELTNAQFIKDLGEGIAKIIDNGLFALAVVGTDYANQETIDAAIPVVQQSATDAAASAERSKQSSDDIVLLIPQFAPATEKAVTAAASVNPVEMAAALLAISTKLLAALTMSRDAAIAASVWNPVASTALNKIIPIGDKIKGYYEDGVRWAPDTDGYAHDATTNAEKILAYKTNLINHGFQELPKNGDLDLNGHRIINLSQSIEEDFDVINHQFLDDLLHDRVEIIWQ